MLLSKPYNLTKMLKSKLTHTLHIGYLYPGTND